VSLAPVLVGIGGAAGAVLRFLVSERFDRPGFATGTVAVNVVGSFALGLLAFGGVGGRAGLLLGTGACGAFTTFSSFSVDVVERWQAGQRGRAVASAVGTFVAAAGAVLVAAVLA